MTFIRGYLLPRLIQYILVIFVGRITAVFIIPRLAPSDPVRQTLGALQSRGTYLEPELIDQMAEDLTELYGLDGSMLDQYFAFWGRLFRGDFGVSFFQFPTPVSQLVRQALPWTLGLLVSTTLIGFVVGILLGGLAGYFNRRGWSRALDVTAMLIRPFPYYIFAFGLLLLFGYVFRLFPVAGGTDIGRVSGFNWGYIQDVLRHSFLPALSLILLGWAAWFQTMKLVAQNVNSSDFVRYAKMGGIKEGRIVYRYVIRNGLLPQIRLWAW